VSIGRSIKYRPREKGTTRTGEVSDEPSEKGEPLGDRTSCHTNIFAPLGDFLPLERDYLLGRESGVDHDCMLEWCEGRISDTRTALEKFDTFRRYFNEGDMGTYEWGWLYKTISIPK
jgi:hypothetical protein